MSRTNNTFKSDQDDRLADFTDEIMTGQAQPNASRVDEELLLLEETVQRLKMAYPPVNLDEARVKQMHVRLKGRIRREEQKKEQSIWKQWVQVLQTNPQMGTVAGISSILLIFAIVSPLFSITGSSTSAAALTPTQGPWVMAALAGVILFILWIKRRK